MGFAEAVTRRPLVVVAAWIVVALVAFPLFAKLSSVARERMYTLPPASESMRAMKLVEGVMGKTGGHVGVIVVDGVDLRDNGTLLRLVAWGREYNGSVVGRYVSSVQSIPTMLAELNETFYRAMLKAVNASAQGALELYSTLTRMDMAWNATLVNVTATAERLNETVKAVMEADRGFVEAYRGLLKLRGALEETLHGVVSLDGAYSNTTSRMYELLEALNTTAAGLAELDRAYSTIYSAAKAAEALRSALSNWTLVSRAEELLGLNWWQASRTYYYLNLTRGNYTAYTILANLSPVEPGLKPLPRSEALAVYRAVGGLVGRGYGVDEASLTVAVNMTAASLPANMSKLLPVLAGYWRAALLEYRNRTGVEQLSSLYQPPPRHAASQLYVLRAALNISKTAAARVSGNATGVAASLVAGELEAHGLPRQLALKLGYRAALGNLSAADAAEAAAELAAARGLLPRNATAAAARVLVELDPGARGAIASNRTLALQAAARLLSALQGGAVGELASKAASLLAAGGKPDRRLAARLALEALEERLPPQAKQLLPVVARYDPLGEGLLARNTSLAARAAAEAVYGAASRQGAKLSPTLVEELARLVAEGRADNETLKRTALDMVAGEAAKRAGGEAAKLIARIIEEYDPNAVGALASNATLAAKALYEAAGKTTPLSVEDFVTLALHPSKARSVAAKLFQRMAVEKAPKEMREAAARLASIVVREGPGISSGRAWEIVERLLEQEAGRKGGNMPEWLKSRLAEAAVRVARGGSSAEAEAARLAELLLVREAAPKLLEESKGLMVSRDYRAFTIIVSPLGSTQSERAGNVEAAGRLAGSLLHDLGLGGFKVYVSGEDVLLHQVKSYAVRDAEKASKLSELGTFIVLLVLLESLLAVLLPYIGIVLGLAVGGAIVYLAASHGVIDFSSHTQSVMITTALGLGADYAGYLVHRFREEYAHLGDAREAARRSLKRAGPAVVASALTVMIGFGSLLLAWDIGFLRGFGEAIPVAVGSTALATLTLVPALLSLIGGRSWFWWPRRPRRERFGRESRLMQLLVRHEKAVIAVTIAAILVAGYFYVTFQGTHDMKLMLPSNAPALKALRVLSAKFEAGITDPVYIVAKLPGSLWNDTRSMEFLKKLAGELERIEGVGLVQTPLQPYGKPLPVEEARKAGAGLVSKDGRTAIVQVILSVDPYSRSGVRAVREVHRVAHSLARLYGVDVYVGGSPYATLEMDDILTHEFYTRVLPAAATLMILAFTLIFGGLIASMAALAVIVGAAMIGITLGILIFRWLYGEDVLWFLHIISLAAVMGVGMDYNSFFLARALEEYHKADGDSKKAVVRAAGAVSRFIVGLSLVVTVAYASLMTASNTGMREMGFTLAATVFTAGVMASYLLTPLVVSMLGRHAWWPWGLRRRPKH